MKTIVFILMLLLSATAFAQQQEQALEDIAEEQETEIEDDSFLQQLDLNTVTESDLQNFQMLTPLQVKAFIQYRELLGKFVSVYELQAIPHWDVVTIKKILPYVTISEQSPGLTKGSGTLLARFSKKILFRYKYNYKNLLQYGALINKDGSEKNYSFHVFARNLGTIQSLALGDFTVNMGQGLIHWQTLALGKSAEITGAKRQSAILRPYNSPGKDNFHRGVAVSLKRRQLTATTFASFKDQLTVGGTVALDRAKWHVATNVIHYSFSTPVEKRDDPYNLFAFRGTRLTNYSAGYDYTFRNVHGFGEVAASSASGFAMVHGLLVSLDRRADASLVVRHLTPAFQSLYARAFTESSTPSNESGLFLGLTLKPGRALLINMYADVFRFPWLKARADAPSIGHDYQLQVSWQPNKKVELYSRLHVKAKQANDLLDGNQFYFLQFASRTNWRLHLTWKPIPALMLRQRVELVWFNRNKPDMEQGYLIYNDAVVDVPGSALGFSGRVAFFETNGFNSRIYIFETDVPSSYPVRAVYHKGCRYYVNFKIDFSKAFFASKMRTNLHVQAHIRWAQTINEMQAGTEFQPKAPGELKLQLVFLEL